MHIEKTITILIVIACMLACATVCVRRPQSNCGVSLVLPYVSSLGWTQVTRLTELDLCPPGLSPALTGLSRQWKSTCVHLSLPSCGCILEQCLFPCDLADPPLPVVYVRLPVLSVLDVVKIKMEVYVGVGGNHAEPLVPGLLVGLRHGKHRRKMGRGREEYQAIYSLVYSLTTSHLFSIFWLYSSPYQSLSHPHQPYPLPTSLSHTAISSFYDQWSKAACVGMCVELSTGVWAAHCWLHYWRQPMNSQ